MTPELLAVVLLAGPCAEARVRGLRVDRVFSRRRRASDDREAIAELGLGADAFVAASVEALALIDKDWPVIEKVAAALEQGYDLEFEEVEAIVDASG